jgi:hypothetical protein
MKKWADLDNVYNMDETGLFYDCFPIKLNLGGECQVSQWYHV